MGYTLVPVNKKVGGKRLKSFEMGAFSFLKLIEICGYLFSCVVSGPSWICNPGLDERMGKEDKNGRFDNPKLLSNDGFKVTDEEARIMARMVRNFIAVRQQQEIKIRTDWIILFQEFYIFAEASGGFKIK